MLRELLENCLAQARQEEKRQKFAAETKTSPIKRGMGIAAFLHGAGFTGSGERYLDSVVGIEGTADGSVRILVSSTEFGQGTNTVLCQVAAETLGIPYECVDIAQADTTIVPNSGPTVASRTAMVIGNLVRSAAIGLRQTLQSDGTLKESYTSGAFVGACRRHVAEKGVLRSLARYSAPEGIYWDDVKYKGEAYSAYAWA